VPILFWDASALTKHYVPETGSDVVDQLFSSVPAPRMVGTLLGYAETFSAILRYRNRGIIAAATFTAVKSSLRNEVLDDPDFLLLSVDDTAVLDGIPLIEGHNLNASDSAILAVYLRYVSAFSPTDPRCLLIAADKALVAAARAEGLRALDPETLAAADVPAFLAAV
jgi:hypothetical protein